MTPSQTTPSSGSVREADCRLYLITPPRIDDLDRFTALLDETLAAGDVACLQIRLKDLADADLLRAAKAIVPVAQAHDVDVLINDRPDMALQCGADGVHIGQEDMPYKEARALLGPDRIIGVTCHDSRHLAMDAGEQGADYVAFGAFFPTTTKAPKTQAKPELLTWWSQLFEIPCVAIGGITIENAPDLVNAGADFLAVSGGVWNHPEGPAKAVAAFAALLREMGDDTP